jgi:hypothetical protein
MATDLVCSATAYTSKEELAVGHRIPGRNKRRSRALAQEIAATQGFDRHKLTHVIWFELAP